MSFTVFENPIKLNHTRKTSYTPMQETSVEINCAIPV